jgi:CO/xanthine dehydrogenase FAD-binding subunit
LLRAIDVPQSTAEALISLARTRDALVIGGGTLVMPKVQAGLSGVGALISLAKLKLDKIAIKGDKVTIGAATTLAAIGEERGLAFLHPAIESVGSPTLRNLATIGGNLFTEQPYGDIAVCLLALDAQATVAAKRDVRKIAVAEILKKGIGREAIVTAISFKKPDKGTWFYRKAMRRAANSASIVTIAAHLPQRKGRVAKARIALGGCGSKPVLAVKAAAALDGQKLDADATAKAGALLIQDAEPFTDAYASAWYRTRVLPVHFRRAILGE